MLEINEDIRGNKLPKNFKLEHLVSVEDAVEILIPESYTSGLIVRCHLGEEDERLLFVHSEEIFIEIYKIFEGVEILLNWGLLTNIDFIKKLSG